MTRPGSAVGIVGLGLIGGSLARDLAAAGWRVRGADRDAGAVAAARQAGVIEGPIPEGRDPTGLDPTGLDLLVLAVPVRAAPDWLHDLAGRIPDDSDLVLTDVGSTKESVARAAAAAGLASRFVGSHPMTGDHRSGWAAARTGLFRGVTVWLCPEPAADARAVERVDAMWRAVGGAPRRVDATEHDRTLAHTSHLPQAVSTALAAALARSGFTPHDLGPGGRDTTRLAGSDPDMWLDILLDNAAHVVPAMEAMSRELDEVARSIRQAREARLHDALSTARAWTRSAAP